MRYTLFAATLLAFFALETSAARAEETNVTIGTAGVTGVYYPAGGAICRLVNRGRKEHNIRCAVESTGGSIDNLQSVHEGDLQFGIVQSDLLYHAYHGTEIFTDAGADKKLRIVFALHSEPFTLVTRQDAKINGFDDLKGKRVNLGTQGSGMRLTMEELMARKGWSKKTFGAVVELKPSDLPQALCKGRIDAMVFAGGHPNGATQQVTSSCATKIVNVKGDAIEALLKQYPFYYHAGIPGGMYVGTPKDVQTFGVKAVLVTSVDTPDEVVYTMVKSVFERLEDFKTLHPVFSTLDAKQMVADSNVAPIHPGALKYFKEHKLLPAGQ